MKIKEVITPAMSESINWIQAAQILAMSDWTAGRWNERGYDGLYDRLARRPSPKGVPLAEADSTAGHFERTNGKNKRCTKPIRPLIRVESSDCIWVPAPPNINSQPLKKRRHCSVAAVHLDASALGSTSVSSSACFR